MCAADAVVAECPDDRRNLVTLYNADPHKIAVIPCGFASEEFWPIAPCFARRALGLRAQSVIEAGRGATARNYALLAELLHVRL